LRFYAELNDFLASAARQRTITRAFAPRTSIKDLIERIGVPHTEIDLLLVNGAPVDFDYRVQDGDRISVYPVFESLDIADVTRVRPVPLRVLRFALDQHLGQLAAYLRMAGFDTGAEHTSMRYEPCSSARSQKLLRGWMHKIAV
jgi:hypothetical protein